MQNKYFCTMIGVRFLCGECGQRSDDVDETETREVRTMSAMVHWKRVVFRKENIMLGI